MVCTTRSRASPSPALLPLSPKQEDLTEGRVEGYAKRSPIKERERKAHFVKGRVSAQTCSAKQERKRDKEQRTCGNKRKAGFSAQKCSLIKEEIIEQQEHSCYDEDVEDEELDDADDEDESEDMTKPKKHFPVAALPSPYESLRLQRIAQNKARMAALGVQKHAASLTSFFQASKPGRRPWKKSPVLPIELQRRSDRLKNSSPSPGFYSPSFTHSYASERDESPNLQIVLRNRVFRNYQDGECLRPGNAPLPKNCPLDLQISPVLSALRCRSKERGTLYDAIVGICCHFCRQKKLCGEEDCERCGNRDVTKACSGKSNCSKCHSSTGVFCRACLKIRYGEDIEQVRERDDWLCPHCSEEQGLNPYWICNSSICLSRRKISPTGIAIFKAREMGYKSVAHYLADLLEKQCGNLGSG